MSLHGPRHVPYEDGAPVSLVLAILIRGDLVSMNPGKAAAQACHAANVAVKELNKDGLDHLISAWEGKRGFGTTLTYQRQREGDGLVGLKWSKIQEVLKWSDVVNKPEGFFSQGRGIVIDPTYPISDGGVDHIVSIETCAWVFGELKHVCAGLERHGLELMA